MCGWAFASALLVGVEWHHLLFAGCIVVINACVGRNWAWRSIEKLHGSSLACHFVNGTEVDDAGFSKITICCFQLLLFFAGVRGPNWIAVLVVVAKTLRQRECGRSATRMFWAVSSDRNRQRRLFALFHNEVNHACNSVWSIDRRCAIGQDFNTLNGFHGDGIEINCVARVGRRKTSAV